MNRHITLGCALLWLGPHAWAKKPPLPPINACYGPVCLEHLRWVPASSFFNKPYQTIEGILVNRSSFSLSLLHLTFNLMSGANVAKTVAAISDTDIQPGGRWYFVVEILPTDPRIFLTRSDTVEFSCTLRSGGDWEEAKKTLHFDPLFSPGNRSERIAWEKLHGKRER